jgi:uncharacterized SAM-binding protein YcdF (DUF218 family)
MANIVESMGIERSRILIEDQSFDSLGNAIFTVQHNLQDQQPCTLYVVTSPFHMPRALYIFQQVLGPSWKVVAYPADEWSEEWRQPGAAAAMVRARNFFSGITPGDLEACKNKLFSQVPAYRGKRKAA